MRLRVKQDARPQAMTLLVAAAISVILRFIPILKVLVYPFRIFVTFIHEGAHAFVALLTGNSVNALTVAMDGSGLTYSTRGGFFSDILISSAGYVGSMVFGTLLLILIRKAVSARIVLLGSAALIFVLTLVFGMFKSLISGAWSGIPFTFVAGLFLTAGLVLIARYASARAASFFVSFLAVQCILNALLDLKSLFLMSTPFGGANDAVSDAVNMANATGIPALFWAVLWIVLSLGILWFAMRVYVVSRDKANQPDLPFEDLS
jgi:hypothetical protein